MASTTIVFSDLNSFTPDTQPVLVNVQSVYQSLYNILNTRKGERLFEPNFGINLTDELFELADDITTLAIMQDILTAINTFEPRVTIDTVNSAVTLDTAKKTYNLQLVFNIVGVNTNSFTLKGSFS